MDSTMPRFQNFKLLAIFCSAWIVSDLLKNHIVGFLITLLILIKGGKWKMYEVEMCSDEAYYLSCWAQVLVVHDDDHVTMAIDGQHEGKVLKKILDEGTRSCNIDFTGSVFCHSSFHWECISPSFHWECMSLFIISLGVYFIIISLGLGVCFIIHHFTGSVFHYSSFHRECFFHYSSFHWECISLFIISLGVYFIIHHFAGSVFHQLECIFEYVI